MVGTIDTTTKPWYKYSCNINRYNQQYITKIGGNLIMENFSKINVASDARTELHNELSLTGAEISINNLPAGACVPFVHAHKQNEEIYAILSGKGRVVIDGEDISLTEGDWIRISPAAKRQFFASEDSAIRFICIQVKENSLEGFTMEDAIV